MTKTSAFSSNRKKRPQQTGILSFFSSAKSSSSSSGNSVSNKNLVDKSGSCNGKPLSSRKRERPRQQMASATTATKRSSCPICGFSFSPHFLKFHAATCQPKVNNISSPKSALPAPAKTHNTGEEEGGDLGSTHKSNDVVVARQQVDDVTNDGNQPPTIINILDTSLHGAADAIEITDGGTSTTAVEPIVTPQSAPENSVACERQDDDGDDDVEILEIVASVRPTQKEFRIAPPTPTRQSTANLINNKPTRIQSKLKDFFGSSTKNNGNGSISNASKSNTPMNDVTTSLSKKGPQVKPQHRPVGFRLNTIGRLNNVAFDTRTHCSTRTPFNYHNAAANQSKQQATITSSTATDSGGACDTGLVSDLSSSHNNFDDDDGACSTSRPDPPKGNDYVNQAEMISMSKANAKSLASYLGQVNKQSKEEKDEKKMPYSQDYHAKINQTVAPIGRAPPAYCENSVLATNVRHATDMRSSSNDECEFIPTAPRDREDENLASFL